MTKPLQIFPFSGTKDPAPPGAGEGLFPGLNCPADQSNADGGGAGVHPDGHADLVGVFHLGPVGSQLQKAAVDGLSKGRVLLPVQAEAGGQAVAVQVDLLLFQVAEKSSRTRTSDFFRPWAMPSETRPASL